MNAPQDGYRAGYGNPPRQTRWKKGQSGNPRHRKHKQPGSTLAIIDRLLLAPRQITLNGEAKTASALEAILFQLLQKAMSGSGRAFRCLLKYQEFANRNIDKKLRLTFVDNDYTRAFGSAPSRSDDA